MADNQPKARPNNALEIQFKIKVDGIPESTSHNVLNHHADDAIALREVLTYLKCDETVVNMQHLGKYNASRVRGLLVEF